MGRYIAPRAPIRGGRRRSWPGGGHALLARLEAANPEVRDGAHALLVALRGQDLGQDPAAWRAWVASLGPIVGGDE